MADRHNTPSALALTLMLGGWVAMTVTPVGADETQSGTTVSGTEYRRDMTRMPVANDSQINPGAVAESVRTRPPAETQSARMPDPGRWLEQRRSEAAPVLRLPPIGSGRTPDLGPEKSAGREAISSEMTSRRLAARTLPPNSTPGTARPASPLAETPPPAEVFTPPHLVRPATGTPDLRPTRPSRVTQIAADQYHRAISLSEKGALYSAEELLIQTLWLIAQSGDVAEESQVHGEALASALQAWREAEDLAPALGPNTTDSQIARLIAAHRTPVRRDALSSMSAVDLLQSYYAYSQQQLLQAVGHEPVASQVLYGLGRLQTAPSRISTTEQRLAGAKAIAMLQCALDVDHRNYAAANELGVLLARCGRLEEAKAVFLQAVSVAPAMESWQNLAAVGDRMGDAELSRQAHLQYQMAREIRARGETTSGSGSLPEIRWVSLAMFAGSPPQGGAAVTGPQHPAPPAHATPSVPGEKESEGGVKGLLAWLPGWKTKSPMPQPASPPTTASRDVPNHFVR